MERRSFRIAVATSGGDAPGMNTAVRAIVKGVDPNQIAVIGVRHGALGLIRNSDDPPDYVELTRESVSGMLDRAETVLGTAREDQILHFVKGAAANLGKAPTVLESPTKLGRGPTQPVSCEPATGYPRGDFP